MKSTTYKLTTRARREIEENNLAINLDYIRALEKYSRLYQERRPGGVPDRNMIKALRLLTFLNTADDWARLHTCEAALLGASE